MQLLTKHQWAIEGYLTALVVNRSDVEDLMQEVSLTLWNKFDQYDASRGFFHWACGIAYIEVLRLRRRRARDRHWFSESMIETLSTDFIDRKDLMQLRREALAECLGKLAPHDRETIQSRYFHGRTVEELAEVTRTPASTIYKRLARIRRALQRCVSFHTAREGGAS